MPIAQHTLEHLANTSNFLGETHFDLLFPIDWSQYHDGLASPTLRLTLLSMQAICIQPTGLSYPLGFASLLRAAPYIFGTMLGVQGAAFRGEYRVDLKQLFGLEGETPTSANESKIEGL